MWNTAAVPRVAAQYAGEQAFSTSFPEGGELIFIGVSHKTTYKTDSINLALNYAAYKAACFQTVVGKYAAFNSTGGGRFLDFTQETGFELEPDESNKEAYERYLDSLTYDEARDVYEVGDTVYVRAHYADASLNVVNRLGPREADGAPSWIAEQPVIPGYAVGVGTANRRTYHAETIKDSFINTVVTLVTMLNPSIKNDSINVSSDDRRREHTFVTGEDTLSGFCVLDFWTDPSGAVWTLGVARK
jgi:hypothetical protein